MLGLGVRKKPGPRAKGKPWKPWKQLLGKNVMDPHHHAICVGSGSRSCPEKRPPVANVPYLSCFGRRFWAARQLLGSDPVDQFPSMLFPQLTLDPRCDVKHDPLCHLANSETYAFLHAGASCPFCPASPYPTIVLSDKNPPRGMTQCQWAMLRPP